MTPILFVAQATTAHLVGWWMAIAMFLPFVGWAWLISSKLDKDAKYFHLNYQLWNGVHLGCGILALLAMLFVPVPGLSWFIGVLILLSPVLVYWKVRNQSVPEGQRFSLTGQSVGQRMAARRQARASRVAVIQFTDSEGAPRPAPMKESELFPTHMVSEDILGPALEARASRIEVAIGPNGATVNQMIDGVRYKRDPLAADAALPLMDYLKDIAGLDVKDRRRRQSGRMSLSGPSGQVAIDLICAGSSTGQVMRIELDRRKRLARKFDDLGLLPAQVEALATVLEPHDRHGVVLVGAPSGQGLTTSAYSFLSRHDAYTANIKTLEREVLRQIDGIDHITFDPDNADIDFATNLQSILRRDPDIVMVGQIKDAETAAVAIEPGMSGPLIYVCMESPTIVDMIRQWVKLAGDVKQAMRGLRAVTNQRLMRTLCPNCRQAHQPTPEEIKKLNLPADKAKQFYRASGKVQVKNKIENCPVCGGTGYLGQTAAYEIFLVDDEARKILSSGDLKKALTHARRNKMIYLQEAALSKVHNGETTIEEVVRATTPSKSETTRAA